MKKIIIAIILTFVFIFNTYSYTASTKDTALIDNVSSKIEKIIETKWEKYKNVFIERLEEIKDKTNKERLIFIIDEIISKINNVEDELWWLFNDLDEEWEDLVKKNLECTQLYEIKKNKYWKKIWQSKVIYNQKLKVCLAYNIYNDFESEKYYSEIKNLLNDSTLLYYSTKKWWYYYNEDYDKITCWNNYVYFEFIEKWKNVKKYGCDTDKINWYDNVNSNFSLFDKMFDKLRGYWFFVCDWFSCE
jgi:hypothetical protein